MPKVFNNASSSKARCSPVWRPDILLIAPRSETEYRIGNMIILHEIKNKTVNIALVEVLDSHAKEWEYIRRCPSIQCEIKPIFDWLEVLCNGGAWVLIHIGYVTQHHLRRVDLNSRVEHDKNFAELFILNDDKRVCMACWPCCDEILKAASVKTWKRRNSSWCWRVTGVGMSDKIRSGFIYVAACDVLRRITIEQVGYSAWVNLWRTNNEVMADLLQTNL